MGSRPFTINYETRRIHIDVRAVQQQNGSRQEIMLAEIKCFMDEKQHPVDLYTSLGQYLLYRAVLSEAHIQTPLYLAIPHTVYEKVFDAPARRVVRECGIKMILVDLSAEEIVRWLD